MRSVKSLYWWLLAWEMWLAGTVSVLAQPCTSSPNPPACTFVAVDVQTNEIVEKLCVGRPVRFDLCAGRPPLVYFYQVLPGTNTYPNPCGPGLRPSPFTYTPTAAGPVTVTENGQAPPGGTSTIFFRVFEVYDNPAPAFTAAACAPGFVRLTLPSAPYSSYSVQIGSSTFSAASGQSGTFAVPPGATSITVAGVYADNRLCTRSATQPLPQLAAPGPLVMQRLSLQGSTAVLDVAPLVAGYRYSVEQADFASPTAFQPVPTAAPNGLSGFTVPGARPGLYRLRRTDDCQQAQAVSDALSTLTLTAQATERRNELSWQLAPDPSSYELTRNGTPLPAALPPGARTYADTAVACGISYTYRLTARYPGGVSSVSDVVVVRATATQAPPTPRLLGTFDVRNRVVLTANVARFPATGQLTYLRDNTPIGTTTARTRRDSLSSYTLAAAPCYQVRFEDDCANLSALSQPFCPAVLVAELADNRGSSVRLQWSALRGAPAATAQDSLRYRLLVLNPDNSVRNSYAVGARGTYLDLLPPADQQAPRYRLEISGAGLPAPSYSNIATVVRALEAYVPTAFSPNGDGLNDVLEVKGRFLTTFTFLVVDRNGQEVFRGTNKSQTWDGRIRNEKPVPGAYVWRLEARDAAGKTVVQHGTVTIVK